MRQRASPPQRLSADPVARTADTDSSSGVPVNSDPGFRFSEVSVYGPAEDEAAPVQGVRDAVALQSGFDLSAVELHPASPLLQGSPLEALTVGREVHLASGWQPDAFGRHVLAHELAHTVQQATGAPGNGDQLETEAETVAEQSLSNSTELSNSRALSSNPDHSSQDASPRALNALPAASSPVAQAFDPRYHRTSVVGALSEPAAPGGAASGFTPEEIGAIYAANWERDLSQAHPSLANVILAWKSVKLAAANPSRTDASIAAAEEGFNSACGAVVAQVNSVGVDAFKNANAYGGYAFWEHMDNPGAAINNAMNDPAQRVKLEIPADTGGLASHLYVSREYIKQMLFDAVKAAHPDFDLTGSSAQTAADASRRRLEAMRAANMGSGDNFAHPGSVPALPGGAPAGSSAANPSSPVRDETAAEVRRNHPGVAGSGMANDARYDLLGHASHALEDFWSHSNFVEIAIGEPKLNSSQAGLVNTPEAGRGAAGVGADGLTTSTFDSDDSSHSLAHKIRGASDEIQAETALLQHALGRSSTLPSAGDVVLGDERTPTPEGEGEEGHSGWDLFGKGLGAMGEGGWSNFVRNPATIGAGLGGVAGGSMRGWRNWGGGSGWKSWLGTGLGTVGTTAAGALGGLIGGGLSGFVGGAAAGGSSFGSSVEDWTGSSVLGGIAAGVGGIVGGAGGLVSGGISGLVGGIGGGLSSFFSDPGRATTTAEDGVLGSSVFGEENLVKVGASLTVSGSGVALLRGVAEMIEDKTRETQKDKPGSHTMLAKDQPGHDAAHDPSDPDSARDALKTAKFNLAHALSTAADRMIIGEMHKALSAPDAAAAKATLEAVNAKLDQLVGPPGPGHPLWGLVLEHRERAERALQGQYGARPPLGPGDFPAPRGNNVPV